MTKEKLIQLEKIQRKSIKAPAPDTILFWIFGMVVITAVDALILQSYYLARYLGLHTLLCIFLLPPLRYLIFMLRLKIKLRKEEYSTLCSSYTLIFEDAQVVISLSGKTLYLDYNQIGQVDICSEGFLIYFNRRNAAFFIQESAFANQKEKQYFARFLEAKNENICFDYTN